MPGNERRGALPPMILFGSKQHGVVDSVKGHGKFMTANARHLETAFAYHCGRFDAESDC